MQPTNVMLNVYFLRCTYFILANKIVLNNNILIWIEKLLCIHRIPEWKLTMKFKTDGPKLFETEASNCSPCCYKNDRLNLIVYNIGDI